MTALSFPNNPVDGQRYPNNPGIDGTAQYEWNAAKGAWNIVSPYIKANTQPVFNGYVWPEDAPTEDGFQLLANTDGTLNWGPGADPVAKSLGVLENFDGIRSEFTLVESGTITPFTPEPSSNIVIFLGGVPQIPGPGAAYTVEDDKITFSEAPALGTVYYGFSLGKG
jgi:hypothetical protein